MNRWIPMLSALALGLCTATAWADAWSRTWAGPSGGTRTVTGQCVNGLCSRSTHTLAPSGASHARHGQCGYAGCHFTATGVGPHGHAWSRAGGHVHGPIRSHGYRSVIGPSGYGYTQAWAVRRY